MFGINSIYYPGCDNDFEPLEGPFGKDQIIYVDIDKSLSGTLHKNEKKGRKIVIGDAANPPFISDFFDAAFVQDMHAEPKEFDGIVDLLKPEGILIFSTDDCGGDSGTQLEDVKMHESLTELHLPFYNSDYTAFKKDVSVSSSI